MLKRCSTCKLERDRETHFDKNHRYRGGYKAQCKGCENRAPGRTPERNRARLKQSRDRNRKFLWDYYSTNPCVDCGEADPIVLELDHLYPEEKRAGVSQLVHNSASIQSLKTEIAKCEVVCANCHRRRTARTQNWYEGI